MLSRKVMSGGAPTDPYFKNVALLLHGDGTNGGQNNTFIDSSSNNFTITRNGNTTQGSFNPYGTLWSNYFDGSGDYLQWTGTALGSGDFTVECWVNFQILSGNRAVIGSASSSTTAGWEIYTEVDKFRFYSGNTNVISSTQVLTVGRFYHVAAVRSGSTLKLYIDGVETGSATFTNNLTNTTFYVSYDSFAQAHNAYISNVRHVVGTAVYTAAFTPPASPLTAISGTSALTCQSNRFIDKSSNAYAITRNGDAIVTPFAPFSPTSVYTTGLGASGYFDGTGDYLTAPDNAAFQFGVGDFTAEAWIYLTSTSGQAYGLVTIVGNFAYGVTTNWTLIITVSTRKLRFYADSAAGVTAIDGTKAINFNEWNHAAVSRTGGTVKLFLNGTEDGSAADSKSYLDINYPLSIGADGVGNGRFGGYISDVRIVKGTAVYTAAFTPPTSPLTAITNTSLLCNFKNAAIFDSAAKNDLETVGNAQIDTGTKKFGTGSLEFDGTGDWLLLPDNPDLRLGTGKLTVEFWVYLATGDAGSNRGLVSKGTASTGWSVSLNTTQKVVFSYASSTITSSGAITLDAWNHIAVVREGTGSNQTKIYIGGTNDGTGTVSTDFNQTDAMYIGANRAAGDPMKGFIDDLRITKGVARYTANFTPPALPFPNK